MDQKQQTYILWEFTLFGFLDCGNHKVS